MALVLTPMDRRITAAANDSHRARAVGFAITGRDADSRQPGQPDGRGSDADRARPRDPARAQRRRAKAFYASIPWSRPWGASPPPSAASLPIGAQGRPHPRSFHICMHARPELRPNYAPRVSALPIRCTHMNRPPSAGVGGLGGRFFAYCLTFMASKTRSDAQIPYIMDSHGGLAARTRESSPWNRHTTAGGGTLPQAWASDTLDGARMALKAVESAALRSETDRMSLDGIHSPAGQTGPASGFKADRHAERLCAHMDREAEGRGVVDTSDIAKAAAAAHGLAVAGMDKQAVAVVLRVFCGMSYQEIADATGCCTSTALSRYRTGVDWLDSVGPVRAAAGLGLA